MQKKILVTDDALFMRSMLRDMLQVHQYAVIEASNGQEAIDLYEAHHPDLVIMDITMPVMDGLAAIKPLKSAARMRAWSCVLPLASKRPLSRPCRPVQKISL